MLRLIWISTNNYMKCCLLPGSGKEYMFFEFGLIICHFSLQINNDLFRKDLERMVGNDDSKFTGVDLAMLIRNKYGRSYDVQLIKKVFIVT